MSLTIVIIHKTLTLENSVLGFALRIPDNAMGVQSTAGQVLGVGRPVDGVDTGCVVAPLRRNKALHMRIDEVQSN